MIADFEKAFKEAREKEDLRSILVQSTNLGEYGKYVERADYYTSASGMEARLGFESGFVMSFCPHPSSMRGNLRRKGRIVVYPRAFSMKRSPIRNWEDFLNLLLHHEGEHGRQYYDHADYIAPNLALGMDGVEEDNELLACANQINHFSEKNSREFRESIQERHKMLSSQRPVG